MTEPSLTPGVMTPTATTDTMVISVDPTTDKVLGVFLLVCVVCGCVANTVTLYFFALRQKCAALVSILSMLVCVVGVVSCVMYTPVMVSLLAGRAPVMFAHSRFCEIWDRMYSMVLATSMFLLLVLSAAQSTTILRGVIPSRRFILIAVAAYAVISLINSVLKKMFEEATFTPRTGYCVGVAAQDDTVWRGVSHAISILQIAVVWLLACGSFALSAWKLRPTRGNAARYQATVTICILTALFLVCHLPLAMVTLNHTSLGSRNNNTLLHETTSHNEGNTTRPHSIQDGENIFMTSYSWLIARILLPALNTLLNPVVFCCRIPGLGNWIRRQSDVLPERRVKGRHVSYLETLTKTLTVNPSIFPATV